MTINRCQRVRFQYLLPMSNDDKTKRWKLTVEYCGTKFAGWQRQADNIQTVQSAVEDAIERFCQQKITIHAAGRTDAGVHAWGQVIHFDLDYGDRVLTGFDLAKAINAHLRPLPVSITHAEIVAQDFHARFQATNKLYIYRIINRPSFLAIESGKAWHVKKSLDAVAMHDAAQVLVGHHDFSTFRASLCQAKTPVRTLERLDVEMRDYDHLGGKEICIYAEARSFLHHQVRNMVGSLTLVGEGKWTQQDLKNALEAKNRKAGGPTAPSEGLYLARIDYGGEKLS